MVVLRPLLLGAALALTLSPLPASANSTEELLEPAATQAAELGQGASLSNQQQPGQFPALQQGQLPLNSTDARLKQSEVVVRDRCTHRPLFDQTLAFDCQPVVLPANIGGAEFDEIPELGVTDLERLDAGTLDARTPLLESELPNSASNVPDPLGLGVQLRL